MRHLAPATRGPAEHERREQIMAAAGEHFHHYGYRKTTVADLAKAIGLSTAYVYKFFASKQAIGEAICGGCLGKISGGAAAIAANGKSAGERLRAIFVSVARKSADLAFHDRKMHDLVTASFEEDWHAARQHEAAMLDIVQSVLRDGRASREFERKTPFDETSQAIMLAMRAVWHPCLLALRLDSLEPDAALMASLVLRSLAP